MAWNLPSLPGVGTMATVANWASKAIDCLKYLKGQSGPVTIEDAVEIQGNVTFPGAETVDGVDVSDHSARHENAGTDEISVAGLSGLLADDQHVLDAEVLAVAAALVHATRHENGGADEISVAGLSGLLADNQNPVVHGVAKHTDVAREKFIPANAGYGNALENIVGCYAVREFVDAQLRYAKFTMKVPDDYVSIPKIYAVWAANAVGNMYWRACIDFAASGESYIVHGSDPPYGTSASGGAMVVNVQESPVQPSFSGLAIGDYIGVSIDRDASHGDDTLGASAYLFGILFTYTANQ